MEVNGYKAHLPKEETYEIEVLLSEDVRSYFEKEGKKGTRNYKHVMKAKITLNNLKKHGLERVKGSAQFKREGKYPSGSKRGGNQAVDEVKSDQVRVYGGLITTSGVCAYYFVEATTKKNEKADIKQLQRVAKTLGALQDELERRS
eukprot:TRINITY_DN14076_c0_g2_i1.p1 TRINITY_DN14076_c0_g2~~TRINITY_DN14076_c0_g2_i1.p1  ORF type:complete len:146 (+),score=21.15 TRINITY_DN14076_c0_g2_i1:63-500(+)